MARANMSWILDDLATGGDLAYIPEDATAQVNEILDAKVTHIIDTRKEANDHDVWEIFPEVRYAWLPTDDATGHNIPADLFDEAVRIDRLARRTNGAKVFVHCHMGVNRGPSVAYAILLDRGYSPTDAWDMIRAARPQAGLYYAEDALKAHHQRRLVEKNLGFDRHAELASLRKHVAKHMTPEAAAAIQHVIREGHKKDKADYAVVMQRNSA